MKINFGNKRDLKLFIKLLLLNGILFFKFISMPAQDLRFKPYQQGNLIISINNILTQGEATIRGLTADFPYPILSTISVVDSQANLVTGLADTLRWLGPNETAENGLPVSDIWQPLLEYHEEDPLIPPDSDLYHQIPEPLITEVRNIALLPSCTMLVMDVSESMVEEIEQAKEGLRLYVRLFRPIDRGGIVQFSSTVVDFLPMTTDTSALIDKINSATPAGGTAIYDALMKGIDGIKCDQGERGRRSIIIYTDGEDRSSTITPQAVIDSARVHNLPIYTIALGNMTQEDILKLIAEQTNGLFFKAATAEEMKFIYGKLSRIMQNYYVMAHASPDPSFNHTWRLVDLTVTLPDQHGRGLGRYFVGGPPMYSGTDIELNLTSKTDTFIVDAGNTINAVMPGDTFQYLITLKNLGPHLADTVKLVHHLPDSVQYVTASTSPQFVDMDSLVWNFPNMVPNSEIDISVTVKLSDKVPQQLLELISTANLVSDSDTTLANNYGIDTVRVLFEMPEPTKNYDLSLSQVAITDTVVEIAGETYSAVLSGNNYGYSIVAKNFGPVTAYNFTLWDVFPDSVILTGFNIPPVSQTNDTLFWRFDSLSIADSIQITFNCTVKDLLPFYPFPLINSSGIIAENDTTEENNSFTTTVYAISKQKETTGVTDLALAFASITDTFVVINQTRKNAVVPGSQYEYGITLKNFGPNQADSVKVVQVLPDSVHYIQATISPQSINNDSLIWYFSTIPAHNEIPISVTVQLAPLVPEALDKLISKAILTGSNDSTLTNNTAIDTVFVLFPESPPIQKNYNIAVIQRAITDTTIILANQMVKAVRKGDRYRYDLIVKNFGPGTARNFTLWDAIPDSVTFSSSNILPTQQISDSLFWQFDSLAMNDSINISLDVKVADLLPYTPFLLINTVGVIAEKDTLAEDNIISTTVYAISLPDEPQPQNADLAVHQFSVTDSFAVVVGDTLKFVRQSETYSYVITVTNESSSTAENVTIIDSLPDSIIASNFQPIPEINTNDTLIWKIGTLLAQSSFTVTFDATVAAKMPVGRNLLINSVSVSATNEDTTKLNNNVSIDTVFNLVKPAGGWQPLIEATPSIVEVGNSISVSVQVTAAIDWWELWVYFADNQIDSTYADEFISAHKLEPNRWNDIEPKFPVTRMVTQAEQEPIMFELRARDIFGELKTAQASVTVKRTNDFTIDRNVYIPDQQEPLEISFKLSSDQVVRLEVYDITGTRITRITEQQFQAGLKTYQWDGLTENGQQIGSGFYIITIHSNGYQAWKKLMIVR